MHSVTTNPTPTSAPLPPAVLSLRYNRESGTRIRRVNHTTIPYGKHLYVFGGREILSQSRAGGDVGSYAQGVHRYDFRRMTWENVQEKDRSKAVRYPSDSILDGGKPDKASDDIGIKKGRAIYTTPGPRGDHTAVVVGEWMVVYGGRKGSNTSAGEVVYDDLLAYNLQTNLWRELRHEKGCGPGPVFGHSAVVSSAPSREMFIVGGVHINPHDKLVFGYNFKTNRWRSFSPPIGVDPHMIHGAEVALVEKSSGSDPEAWYESSQGERLFVMGLEEVEPAAVTRTTSSFDIHVLDITSEVWSRVQTTPSPSSPIPFRMCELRQAFTEAGLWCTGSCFNPHRKQWYFVVRSPVDDSADDLIPSLAAESHPNAPGISAERRSTNPYGIRGPRNISLLASLPRLLMFTFDMSECAWAMSAISDPLVQAGAKMVMEATPGSSSPTRLSQFRQRHLASANPAKVLLESRVLQTPVPVHELMTSSTTDNDTSPMLATMMGTDWRIQNTNANPRLRINVHIPATTPRPQGRTNAAESKREEADGVHLLETEEQLITVAKPVYDGEPFRRAPQTKFERKYSLLMLMQRNNEGTLIALGGCDDMVDRAFAQIVGEGFGKGKLPFQSSVRIPPKAEADHKTTHHPKPPQESSEGFRSFLVPKKPSTQSAHKIGVSGLGGRLQKVQESGPDKQTSFPA
jgi:hypothetical protein